jgi:PadR family transcriptional regulator, regulatory protein PadR
MKPDLIRGHLDGLLLAVLARGPAHGYAIIQALRARSEGEFDLPEGTIYPALHRLERTGAVASSWSTEQGRPRRVYRLTARGQEALRQERRHWQRFAVAAQRILDPGLAADG